ncbi:helix-hairpin-helix domain-containing protein [Desulfobulbus sp. TB]|nr:helix-hairpin-helix domain-containing protein [Desulfobulbus sp. TB]
MKVFYFTLFFVFFLVTAVAAVVNINTGDLNELTSLPGIGPVKAKAIIQHREEKGLFKKIEDLKEVYGVGPKTIARIKNDITLGEDVIITESTDKITNKVANKATDKITETSEVSKKGTDAVPAAKISTSSDKK